jgi:hypothetical protein
MSYNVTQQLIGEIQKDLIKDKKEFDDIKPVFIVGMNGSGTTMLADSLDNHPDLYIFPGESAVLPFFISKISSFGDLSKLSSRKKLADALGRSWSFWFVNDKKPKILDEKELTQPGFAGVVDSMFINFAASQGKYRWGEKTPMYLQHIELLSTHFPCAQFIHIIRDGRDVAQSFQRRYKKEPCWTIYRWKKTTEMGRVQGKKLGDNRYMEIKYEELTNNPERILEQICNFLSLPYYASLCKNDSSQMDPDRRAGFIVPNSEKWRSYFSEKQIIKLEQIAGGFLTELGYITAFKGGSIDPSRMCLLRWMICDYLKMTWSLFQKRGIRFTPIFIRKAMRAIMQNRTNYY